MKISRLKKEYDDVIERRPKDKLLKVSKNNKYGLIDKNNNIVIPIEYEDICLPPEKQEYYFVYKDNLMGIINNKNNLVVPYMYDVQPYEFPEENYCVVSKGGKFGLIDMNNNTIIPFEYEWLYNCLPNCIEAKKNGKCGFIDINNQKISEFIYDEMFYRSNNQHCVSINKRWGIVDKYGNIIKPIEYPDPMIDYWNDFIKFPKMEDYVAFLFTSYDKYAIYSFKKDCFITDFILQKENENMLIDPNGNQLNCSTCTLNTFNIPITDKYEKEKDRGIPCIAKLDGGIIVDNSNPDFPHFKWKGGCFVLTNNIPQNIKELATEQKTLTDSDLKELLKILHSKPQIKASKGFDTVYAFAVAEWELLNEREINNGDNNDR